ncbi:MAG: hypothetical protein WDZ59_05765 [Pirellulales bacterium]
MASEQQVLDRWQKLFRDQLTRDQDVYTAEQLLEELPDCSPLRQRLTQELEEICSLSDTVVLPENEKKRPNNRSGSRK